MRATPRTSRRRKPRRTRNPARRTGSRGAEAAEAAAEGASRRRRRRTARADGYPARFLMYAIVKVGGKQYRVEKGDQLVVDRMHEDEGAKVTLEPLLYRSDDTIF